MVVKGVMAFGAEAFKLLNKVDREGHRVNLDAGGGKGNDSATLAALYERKEPLDARGLNHCEILLP
jgi:hypothetical protein